MGECYSSFDEDTGNEEGHLLCEVEQKRETKKRKRQIKKMCVCVCIMIYREPRERLTRLHRTLSAAGGGHR